MSNRYQYDLQAIKSQCEKRSHGEALVLAVLAVAERVEVLSDLATEFADESKK